MNAAVILTMLLAPWRQLERSWARRIIYAAVLAVVLASALLLGGPQRWVVPVSVGVLVLIACWMVAAASLLEQNHPHAARFVPGHLRRLQQAALLGWGVASALPALAMWLTLPGPASPALLLLGSSVGMCFVFWAVRNVWLWIALALLSLLAPAAAGGLRPLWQALAALWQAQPLGVLLLALLAQAVLMTRAFGQGDAAHRARYAGMTRMRQLSRQAMEGKQAGLAAWGGPGEWLARPFERTSRAWLHHVLRRAGPGEASVMSRVEIVLHGQQHWLTQLMTGCMAAIVMLAIFGVIAAASSQIQNNFWTNPSSGIGMGIGILSTAFNPAFALPGMLWQTRREQALLRLLPGLPLGAALNRAVARRQLRQGLAAWALGALAMLPLALRSDSLLLIWLALAALPLGVVSLTRRPACLPAPNAWTALLPTVGYFLLGTLLFGLASLLEQPAAVLLPAAGVAVAASALLLVWRWRALVAAPMALPAGRLN